jgi:hypothetical protein
VRLGRIVTTTRRRALAVLVVALLGLAGACGVEVPDDVAEDLRETTTTTDDAPSTTETPTSDDELEQALIDNGYTLAEAECGAENLRDQLGEDEVRSIVDAETIEDISASTARAFADALRPCVEDGAEGDGGSDGPGSGDDDPDGGDGDGIGGGMPDFGDDSEGDVSRSRFLSGLISAGIGDEEARCVVDRVYAELDQEDINTLFHAATEDDIPDELLDAIRDITEDCVQ